MKVSRQYFVNSEHDEERTKSISDWKRYMRENGFTTLKVYRAVPDFGSGYFHCREFDEIGETGDGCGKLCKKYEPRNKKNGRCRFSAPVYTSGEEKILKIKIDHGRPVIMEPRTND